MAAINKEAFLKKIGSKKPMDYGAPMPGESAAEDSAPGEEGGESMSCGEQLMHAIDAKDPEAIDAALREAVSKYGNGG